MAAGGGLRFKPRTQEEPELTKAGFLVYCGSVSENYEWEFRAMATFHATKPDERFSLGAKLLESLRGDAYIVAQDLGHDVLKATDAIEKIVEAIRKQIFPPRSQRALQSRLQRRRSHVSPARREHDLLCRQKKEMVPKFQGA